MFCRVHNSLFLPSANSFSGSPFSFFEGFFFFAKCSAKRGLNGHIQNLVAIRGVARQMGPPPNLVGIRGVVRGGVRGMCSCFLFCIRDQGLQLGCTMLFGRPGWCAASSCTSLTHSVSAHQSAKRPPRARARHVARGAHVVWGRVRAFWFPFFAEYIIIVSERKLVFQGALFLVFNAFSFFVEYGTLFFAERHVSKWSVCMPSP